MLQFLLWDLFHCRTLYYFANVFVLHAILGVLEEVSTTDDVTRQQLISTVYRCDGIYLTAYNITVGHFSIPRMPTLIDKVSTLLHGAYTDTMNGANRNMRAMQSSSPGYTGSYSLYPATLDVSLYMSSAFVECTA